MSSPALLAAAVLALAIGFAHSILGERYILMRLFRRGLPHLFGSDVFTKRTLRFGWHLTTLAWWGFAGVLAVLAVPIGRDPHVSAGQAVAFTFAASAVLGLIVTRARHLAWPVLAAIAALAWWGSS